MESNFCCKKCDKEFANKYSMERHYLKCTILYEEYRTHIERLQNEITQLKDEILQYNNIIVKLNNNISELETDNTHLLKENMQLTKDMYKYKEQYIKSESQLQTTTQYTDKLVTIVNNAATRPITNNNKNINYMNLVNITPDRIIDAIPDLTSDIIDQGAIGYANWAYNNFLHNSIICSDLSRNVLQWKSDNNTVIKDNGGNKLCSSIFTTIKKPNYNLLSTNLYKISQDMEKYIEDADEFIKLQNNAEKVNLLRTECIEAASGVKNNFVNSFVKHIVSKIPTNIKN